MLPLAALALLLASATERPPAPILVRDVRLSAEKDAPRSAVLVSGGRIARVAAGELEAPVEARTLEGTGGLALPAFLDAYCFTGLETPEPVADRDLAPDTRADVLVDMRSANRKGVQPAFQAAKAFAPAADALEPWRADGFGALLAAPRGQLLAGQSALFVTRECAVRDAVVRASVFDHAGFSSTGRGYPSTLMGSIAQLRQFLLDARRHAELAERRAAGRPGPRLPLDADLEAVGPALRGERRLCCAAESANDVDRWLALADEHGLSIAIVGGREAWKRASVLAERDVPVILTLDWDEEPEDPDGKDAKKKKKKIEPEDVPWTYEKPEPARREERRLWLEQRDSALRLAEAGVAIAFGTGKEKPKTLLERVRKLVEAGLPREAALAALTRDAAAILGVEGSLGRLDPGLDASFAVWTADPLTDADAKVTWLVVDGHAIDLREQAKAKKGEGPAEGVSASGTWKLVFEGSGIPDSTATLTMEDDGQTKGRVVGATPDGEEVVVEVDGRLSGTKLEVAGKTQIAGSEASFSFSGKIEGQTWSGAVECVIGGEQSSIPFSASREPKDGLR